MSDTQNTNTEETAVVTSETSVEVVSQETHHAPQADRPRGRDGSRPPRGDRRGPRREGVREEEKEFQEEMLSVDRVTRVTAGGRQIRFRASVVIGDGKGRIGFGTGKAGEVQSAIEKAIRDAKKNLITFPIVNGTIPHDVAVNFKSSALYIHPAHPGTGIIAGGAVRKVFAVSGVKDVIAKQHGAPNMITNARVTLKALKALKPLQYNTTFTSQNKSESSSVSEWVPTEKKTVKKSPQKNKAE